MIYEHSLEIAQGPQEVSEPLQNMMYQIGMINCNTLPDNFAFSINAE